MKILKNMDRRFRRSMRAISPVIAVLLMIVIAVAASLVAYAWIMGYIGFTTGRVGKAIQIQSIHLNQDTGVVTVYAQNVGDSAVTLSDVYVGGQKDDAATSVPAFGSELAEKATATITLSGNYAGVSQLTVRVVTSDGTFIEMTNYNLGSGGPGGTTPVSLTERTASRALINNVNLPGPTTVNFAAAPQEGSLLVITVGHRVGSTSAASVPTVTSGGTPWQLAEIENTHMGGSDRRVVAVFYKEAGPSEPTAVTITWTNIDMSLGVTIRVGVAILQEFTPSRDTSYSVAVSGKSNSGPVGSANEVTSLTIPPSTLTAPTQTNILSFAATVWRDDAPAMTSNTFSGGLGNVQGTMPTTTSAHVFTAWANTAVLQTTATMTGSTDPDLVSGVLVLFACN